MGEYDGTQIGEDGKRHKMVDAKDVGAVTTEDTLIEAPKEPEAPADEEK